MSYKVCCAIHTFLGVERHVAAYCSSLFGVFVCAFILACLGLTEGNFSSLRSLNVFWWFFLFVCASKSVQCSDCTSPPCTLFCCCHCHLSALEKHAALVPLLGVDFLRNH